MFFYASKIIWLLLKPLNLVCFLLLAGTALLPLCKKTGRFFLITGLLLFFAGGMLPIGHNMLVFLEGRFEPPELPERIDGFIVLGGYFDTDISTFRKEPHLNRNADRIVKAMELGLKYPNAFIVFSGGSGSMGKEDRFEADDIEIFLKRLDYPDDTVVYEEKSRNTFENIKFSKQFLKPRPSENWVLVTSAYHMPRTMAVARSLNWNLIPYPTDYRTTGVNNFRPRPFHVLDNFSMLEMSVREFLGVIAYRLTGRITSARGKR